MQIEGLISLLVSELDLREGTRETGASDTSLRVVIKSLQDAARALETGDTERAQTILNVVGRQVSDTWSFKSKTGARILEFVHASNRFQ